MRTIKYLFEKAILNIPKHHIYCKNKIDGKF